MGLNTMTIIQKIAQFLGGLSEWSGKVVAWLALLLVLTEFSIVILRYFFNTGWIGMQEAVLYMHAILFLVGAAYTLKHDGHVRVDIFYRILSPRGRALVNLAGVVLLLVPVCGFIFYASWDYIWVAWERWETSTEPGGLPFVYLLKTFILLFAAMVILQGLAWVMGILAVLGGAGPVNDFKPSRYCG